MLEPYYNLPQIRERPATGSPSPVCGIASINITNLTKIITDNQAKMQADFKAAMLKLSTLGQDISKMVDCTEVIPVRWRLLRVPPTCLPD